LFSLAKKNDSDNRKSEVIKETSVSKKEMKLEEAVDYIREVISDPYASSNEVREEKSKIIEDAIAGDNESKEKVFEEVRRIVKEHGIVVAGLTSEQLVYEVYKRNWGLDILDEIYNDPEINEIRVNAPDKVFVLRQLKNERVDISFKNDEHVRNIILRLVMHDQGISLNRNSPTIESMRKDGARITATCPPVTSFHTLTIRKHIKRVIDLDDYVEADIMDENIKNLLIKLVRGRANILVSGGTGSGKTTLIRALFKYTDENCRTLVLESDRELNLTEYYPERDIVELEEHTEAVGSGVKEGRSMKNLFRVVLRYSPTIIIVGEFRSGDEALEAVRACERGHDGSMSTAHFSSSEEAVRGIARLLTETNMVSDFKAEQMVATAFNVIVQMYGDPVRGKIKLEEISELIPTANGVKINKIIQWEPEEGQDYFKGEWREVGKISDRLLTKLRKYNVVL